VPLTRRAFLPLLGVIGHAQQPLTLHPESLTPFLEPLPLLPVAKPVESGPVPRYRIAMREMRVAVHRDLPAVRVWTYGSTWPGATIEARSGQPVSIEWVNQLPTSHFLPIDHNLCGAEKTNPAVRNVVHVHGGRVPPGSDGYPEAWYTPGHAETHRYPNGQEATALWYHDHAMGITRLNTYAGLFGFYIVRDDFEDRLNLPRGAYEIPMIFCDRSFTPDGQLFYPDSGQPNAPWVPEFYGDAALVNGKLAPYLEVQPRRYRFRFLNASNARFYRFEIPGLSLMQIGSDQGLLPAPVPMKRVIVAPGERVDLIVDFAGLGGERAVLKSGPTELLQFRVAAGKVDDTSRLPSSLRTVRRIAESEAVTTRELTLGEVDNMVATPMRMLLNNTHWAMPVTEKPRLNSVEIWSLINLTDDSHPIHLHLVRFQILDRRRFDAFAFRNGGGLRYFGNAMPAAANETGWKDTVQADPKLVTRIIVPFEGYSGRYVWHCHLAEHEDNEMMRPYDVLPA
jgi:spore coat protein A